jgi:uncharacterized protein (TIGR00299 family) protein
MSRVLYIDCFSGVAGDMLLGAMIDAGLPVEALRDALGSLGVDHELAVEPVMRAGLSATHVQVRDRARPSDRPGGHHRHHDHDHEHAPHHAHRSLKEIAEVIEQSALSPAGKARAIALFGRLGEAEAALHHTTLDRVHLHELGATDSIIDIVGAVFGFEWFGIDDVVASPLNLGGGTVQIAHGTYPVPAPATLKLLIGVPSYSRGAQVELVTPTGALLVSDYARSYGPLPAMTVERVGYGAGTRDLDSAPNVVRLVVGERAASVAGLEGEPIVKIECEIDDMSPQLFGPVADRLFRAGAVDVYLTPVQMKKGRPGTLLTALTSPDKRTGICDVLFRETTTIGVRFEQMWRETLDRRWEDVAVSGGRVRVKIASRRGEVLNAVPEFDDCVRIADATGRPVKAVQAEALEAWFTARRAQRGT